MITKEIIVQVKQLLDSCGDTSEIQAVHPVSGGDINQAACVQTKENTYFVKWNKDVPVDFFAKEVEGLRRLRESGLVQVPEVYTWSEANLSSNSFLVLEWLEVSPLKSDKHIQTELGHQLAQLHQQQAASFGLDEDNYLGFIPQENGWKANWVDFFRSQRLEKQMNLALSHGQLSTQQGLRLQKVLDNLENWLGGREIVPALLHGDLWSGNWLVTTDGSLYLIDPAVYYGDREVDIAYSELFGGFLPSFYVSYQESYPLDYGYEERKPLYQLYYLLAYLTLFGQSYGHDVDKIIARYV